MEVRSHAESVIHNNSVYMLSNHNTTPHALLISMLANTLPHTRIRSAALMLSRPSKHHMKGLSGYMVNV